MPIRMQDDPQDQPDFNAKGSSGGRSGRSYMQSSEYLEDGKKVTIKRKYWIFLNSGAQRLWRLKHIPNNNSLRKKHSFIHPII